MVIRSLRTVAVGALRMSRLSSRIALARRRCCLTVAMRELLSLSTVGCSTTSCWLPGDDGGVASVVGCEIVTAGSPRCGRRACGCVRSAGSPHAVIAPKEGPPQCGHLPMMMPQHGERTMKPLQRCREPGSFDTFVQDFRFAASADTHVRRGRVAPFAEPRSRSRLRARHERPGGRRLLGLARSRPVQCVPQALRHNGIGGVGVVIHTRAGRFQDCPVGVARTVALRHRRRIRYSNEVVPAGSLALAGRDRMRSRHATMFRGRVEQKLNTGIDRDNIHTKNSAADSRAQSSCDCPGPLTVRYSLSRRCPR